jgi:hypothetical protein
LLTVIPVLIAILLQIAQPLQGPSPTPSEPVQESQHKAGPEQSKTGTDNNSADAFSSLVDKIASELARRNQQQARNDNQQKPTKDWWAIWNTGLNTLFTGCLVFLMFRQWRAMHQQRLTMDKQARYMRIGLKMTRIQLHFALDSVLVAKKAADAATTSAETAKQALYLAESADIVIQSINMSESPKIWCGQHVIVCIKNCGRTKATDLVIRGRMAAIEQHRSRPQDPTVHQAMVYGIPKIIGGGDEQSFDFPVMLDHAEMCGINDRSLRFWFQASIAYKDKFGHSHELIAHALFREDRGASVFEIETST